MHKRVAPILSLVVAGFALALAGTALGAKPEDVFKGKIIICKKRLPMHFSSAGAFISAVQGAKTDKVWPTEEKGPEQGTWDIEYIAFFAQPLNDNEIQVKFYDITAGEKRYVAGDPHPEAYHGRTRLTSGEPPGRRTRPCRCTGRPCRAARSWSSRSRGRATPPSSCSACARRSRASRARCSS